MKLQRTDIVALSLLLVAGLVFRLPLRSEYLFHWDSVNFAASLAHYDVRLHQPHPPGYVLYSLLGKLLLLLGVGEANASLVWLSLVSGLLGIWAIYILGLVIADRRVALVAALLTLSSPLHWFYSVIALTYTLEYMLVTVVAGLCYVQLMGSRRIWLWSAALLGLVGGVRQNDLIFLLPLWLFSLAILSWPKRLSSLAVLGGVVLAWALPMAALSGGVGGYLEAVGTQSAALASESPFAATGQFVLNAGRMAIYVAYGLLLGALVLTWGARVALRNLRALTRAPRAWFFALWVLPSFSFYLLFHIRQHGHIFTFLPALVLLTAMSAVAIGDALARGGRRWAGVQLAGVLVLANLAFFLLAPASLMGSGRLPLQAPARATLTERDRHLGERIATIRASFLPESTAILAGGADFHHPDYYLPGYEQISIEYQQGVEAITLRDGVTTLVWFDDAAWESSGQVVSGAGELQLPSGDRLHFIRWSPGQRAILSRDGVFVASR